MITVLLSLFLLAGAPENSTSTPAPAADAGSVTNPAPAAAKPATKQRKICKREGATESRLGGTRVCLTAEEWALRKKSEG
jgi:hypothetical protein